MEFKRQKYIDRLVEARRDGYINTSMIDKAGRQTLCTGVI